MLITRSLSFAYNQKAKFNFPDIDLDQAEDLLVLGESGIGKTTLLHLMAGLLTPSDGFVELSGTQLHNLSSTKLDRFRGNHIGVIFQRPYFVNAITLQENLALVQYLSTKKSDQRRIVEIVDRLGIGHKLDEKPQNMSSGEQQRASIALAVINNPQLILADEPTASLDDKNCNRVISLLKEQAQMTKAQLIVITHDQRLKPHFKNMLAL